MWQETFKQDIKIKIAASEAEFNKYKTTQQVIYLQQAGNKLFSAVENFLMIKYDKRFRNYQDLLSLVSNNRADRQLLTQAVQLHYFFYNGDLHMSRYDAEIIYKDVKYKLKNRVN